MARALSKPWARAWPRCGWATASTPAAPPTSLAFGAYRQVVLCTEAQVHALPERVSFAEGAAVNVPCLTAHVALERAQPRAGEVVLVHGASGSVGLAAVQMARAAGLTVIGTAGTDDGLALVAAEGAHHVVGSPRPAPRRAHPGTHQRPRARCHPRDARQREPRPRPHHDRAARPRRGHRQPGPDRDRPAQDHGQARRRHRSCAVGLDERRGDARPRGSGRGARLWRAPAGDRRGAARWPRPPRLTGA